MLIFDLRIEVLVETVGMWRGVPLGSVLGRTLEVIVLVIKAVSRLL